MSSNDAGNCPVYQRNEAVLAARLGAEDIALLDPGRAHYFGLEGPASRIWELLEHPISAEAIYARLVSEYDVEPAVCAEQTGKLIAELLERKLIVVVPPAAQ